MGNNKGVNIPTDPVKKREWIKYRLKLRSTTLAQLGRNHGVSRQAVSSTLSTPNPRMEAVIAGALDLQPGDIWPERYDLEFGIPLPAAERETA